MQKIIIYSDGGARGNPGPAGIGAVLKDGENRTIFEISEYIGRATNNQAEYKAVLAGLNKALEFEPEEIQCFLDSELAVKQLNREYKVKNVDLQGLFLKIYNLTINLKVSFQHIRREFNKEADALVNQAIDRYMQNKA